MGWISTIGDVWLITIAWLSGLSIGFGLLCRLMPCNPGMFWWKNLRAACTDFFYWFLVALSSAQQLAVVQPSRRRRAAPGLFAGGGTGAGAVQRDLFRDGPRQPELDIRPAALSVRQPRLPSLAPHHARGRARQELRLD